MYVLCFLIPLGVCAATAVGLRRCPPARPCHKGLTMVFAIAVILTALLWGALLGRAADRGETVFRLLLFLGGICSAALAATVCLAPLSTTRKIPSGPADYEHTTSGSARPVRLGDHLADILHEIKSPLGSIKTMVQVFPEKEGDAAFRESFCSMVEQEVDRLASLVDSLLQLSPATAATCDGIDLRLLLDEKLGEADVHLRRQGIEIVRRGWDRPAVVSGQRERLGRAFLNLIRNSVEAMEEGGRLIVGLDREIGFLPDAGGDSRSDVPREVVVARILDSGPGVPLHVRELVFEPFFTTKDRGSGLGLAIVRNVIVEHGGRVDVEEDSGEGMALVVRLPAVEPRMVDSPAERMFNA